METKDILKALRKGKGYNNAKDFCDASGISYNTYQNYEAGKRMPPAETLILLADFYGVTTDYLLGREPAPDPFGELRIDPNDEKAVLDRYMSFPPQTRAVLLDALRQLAGARGRCTAPHRRADHRRRRARPPRRRCRGRRKRRMIVITRRLK